MATFAFVLAIAMIGFGNVFYILYINSVDGDMADGNQDDQYILAVNNFLISLIYSFRLGLGDFDTDNFYGK